MRINAFSLAFLVLVCGAWSPGPETGDQRALLLSQRNSDFSAAKKKRPRATGHIQAPVRHGPPDPSFGPDGRPYPVPEYLRGQCYYDDGYGRFSACSNRS